MRRSWAVVNIVDTFRVLLRIYLPLNCIGISDGGVQIQRCYDAVHVIDLAKHIKLAVYQVFVMVVSCFSRGVARTCSCSAVSFLRVGKGELRRRCPFSIVL